jgi:serine/threonine protein phosphatase PrpC/CRP-like cAMP-binding protein
MGCCESVEVDSGQFANHRPPESAVKQPEKALRKVECSDEPREIICGGMRLRYAFLSQKGYYPDDPHKPNQDSYSITERFGSRESNDSFFAVYDGHGRDGDLCAQFARDKMPGYLAKHIRKTKEKEARQHQDELDTRKNMNPDKPSDPLTHVELPRDQFQSACLKAHVECNLAMHQEQSLDDSLSGTTAISVYVHGRRNRISICNVGDSRAVLGKATPGAGVGGVPHGQRDALKAYPLSRDQTPYRRDERARIRGTGARILSLDQLEGLEPILDESQNDDLELGEELDEGGDPPRVWSPHGDYPGTAFTRSLGDAMAEELGVFAEPEMLTREIKPGDKMLVIASDGIYEFLTNQSVIDICAKFTDPLEACRAVVAESYELWLQYELRTDDITIIVVFVDQIMEASTMESEYITSRPNDLASGRTASLKLLSPNEVQVFETQATGMMTDDEDDFSDGELRPVRIRMTKEKAAEIEKLKQNAENDFTAEKAEEVDIEKLYTVKTASEKARIADATKTSVMFRNITDDQREMIYGVMEPITVEAGTWVIKQGTFGDRFYIIDEGIFEVRIVGEGKRDDGNGGALIHVYEGSVAKHSHPCFGELALMYSAPRSASIVARTDGHLWGLHRSAFRQVLAQAQGTRQELMKTLTSIPIFSSLSDDEIKKLASAFNEIAFGRGENIIEQGNFGDSMYVITSGSCGKKSYWNFALQLQYEKYLQLPLLI